MTEPLIDVARRQIEFARNYTQSLLEDIEDDDWFRMPDGCVSHIAWQVGHLSMAQYMLTLFRMRGKLPEDEELIPKVMLKKFIKGSVPDPDPANHPPLSEIRDVFGRVYDQLMAELPNYRDDDLQESVVEPYVAYKNKLGSLFFCASHEMLHAGQIGLIRRLLGKERIR